MSKRVDDVGALFRSLWPSADKFHEFTRAAEADNAEKRWPLMKSMALDKRVLPPPLSMRQKQVWLEQSARALPRLGMQLQNHHSFVHDNSLNQIFDRVEGSVGTAKRLKAMK